MSTQETVNLWLHDYAQAEGIEQLQLDEAGVCGISYLDGGERRVFTIEGPAHGDSFFLTGEVAECDAQGRETLLARALAANLDGEATRGAAFALDGTRLVLCYREVVSKCDAVAFGNTVNNFVAVLDQQRRRFGEWVEPESQSGISPVDAGSSFFPNAPHLMQFA
ncbi:CesT family type III secretion system chaperone [Acanthopleuribacter pedis]|uniref:Type III secretion system chaperone n=1 Tax=Acanthopleuribacter pedis TaxID=442870 RepID=A0A8J7QL80_9BACT|nr:CesT family type III secretion system chaperone [Acanthopleuribacter pedis]MBO1321950.1 type III secretion system chaperone [Acanthopleuribacter pedis]